jgi:hypothetical protein
MRVFMLGWEHATPREKGRSSELQEPGPACYAETLFRAASHMTITPGVIH